MRALKRCADGDSDEARALFWFRDLADQMNPKRVYGSYTLIGVIVVKGVWPQFLGFTYPND